MHVRTTGLRALSVAFALLLPSGADEESARREELVFGMSTALSGPVEGLGKGTRTGVEVCFERVNAAGGVRGRRLALLALDDAYEPDQAQANMERLVGEEGVLAVLGNVGTPTAIRTVPVANRSHTLLLGAVTGAGVLREQPPDRYVVNYRASYADETRAMVDALLANGIRPDEIAFFTQDDGYGDAGYRGAVEALTRRGYLQADLLPHGRYPRKTIDVEEALVEILSAPLPPRAIVMVGTSAPCARFVRLARQALCDTLFLNVSFVGGVDLARALGEDGEGVVVTQVVPHFDSTLPIAREYRADLARFAPGTPPDFASLEGYVVARLLIEGLRRVRGPVTRESLVDGLHAIDDLDIGTGTPIRFDAEHHQASDAVWPTAIRGGRLVPIAWSELPSLVRRPIRTPEPADGRLAGVGGSR